MQRRGQRDQAKDTGMGGDRAAGAVTWAVAGDTLTAGLARVPEVVPGGLRGALCPEGGELIALWLGDKAQVEEPVAVAFESRDRVDLGVAQRNPGQRELLREHLGRDGRDETPGVSR